MSPSRPSSVILDEEFLPIRAKLLEIAAALDRIDRACGKDPQLDPREQQLASAIKLLQSDEPARAEKIQRIFSLEYDEAWMTKYRIERAR